MQNEDPSALWERARKHDEVALSRLLSLVERGGPEREAILELVQPHTGRAQRIGLTGPPGAGKSTLAGQLALHYANQGKRVGVLAVDPSSARTGGALLGDRVRMEELESHEKVFIRSLASRGASGGLSLGASLVADVLDATGHDPIFLETVGVGQGELDVVRKAHSIVLLAIPGGGDHIQLMKAGLLEMADIVVINKADRDGARELQTLLEAELRDRGHGRPSQDGWEICALATTAYRGDGVPELAALLERHGKHLREGGGFGRRRERALLTQLQQLVEQQLLDRLWKEGPTVEHLRQRAAELARGKGNVARLARELAEGVRLPGED